MNTKHTTPKLTRETDAARALGVSVYVLRTGISKGAFALKRHCIADRWYVRTDELEKIFAKLAETSPPDFFN